MIELTHEQVNIIVIDTKSSLKEQKELSKKIRGKAREYSIMLNEAEKILSESKEFLK